MPLTWTDVQLPNRPVFLSTSGTVILAAPCFGDKPLLLRSPSFSHPCLKTLAAQGAQQALVLVSILPDKNTPGVRGMSGKLLMSKVYFWWLVVKHQISLFAEVEASWWCRAISINCSN